MLTIVEPRKQIADLWSKKSTGNKESYRLMRYVLRVDCDGKVLLHNAVTGQLVVLDVAEAALLDRLPADYCPEMEKLVECHYIVPINFDEHKLVLGMRKVLMRLYEAQHYEGITTYTILPTTACNARCYYCFEHGVKAITMTEDTADEVADFIIGHCGPEKKVFITWFGGEPTLAAGRIDQISKKLGENGIVYQALMTSNGYLFDKEMVNRAKTLWNLRYIQICFDGTESNYNRVKSYAGVDQNPYQRVMNNIQMLLNAGIRVGLRMNFDVANYRDFEELLKEAQVRFQHNPLLSVSAHPVIGEYADQSGAVRHGSDEWFIEKITELNHLTRCSGLAQNSSELPSLKYRVCQAASDYALTITPDGMLARCPEQFKPENITGSIADGEINTSIVNSWKTQLDCDKHDECVLYPTCVIMKNCLTSDKCFSMDSRIQEASSLVKQLYKEHVGFE